MQRDTTILIVDDQPSNLGVLFHALEQAGYAVRLASGGESALRSAARMPPSLILLDVRMPEIDGFETCRRLKADPATHEVPVIFLTALADPIDELTGLQLGAVDYITKPIQIATALARIATHLTLRRLQEALQQQNRELDAYARTVAHDLKNPLTTVVAAAQVLQLQQRQITAAEVDTYAGLILRAGRKAIMTIDELLALAGARRATITPRPLEMASIVAEACERLRELLHDYRGELVLPERWPRALGHGPWVELVWANYLSNGLKYGGKPPRLILGATELPNGMVQFWVRDNGPGLSAEAGARLFTEWTRLEAEETRGHGLGLAIVRRIVERLGGSVGVASEPGQGSTFSFTLPRE